jgi:hypothetical protein
MSSRPKAWTAAATSAWHARLAQFGRRLRVLRLVAPGDHHRGPRLRKAARHAKPDAAIAACDDRDASGQFEGVHGCNCLHHLSPGFICVVHRTGAGGHATDTGLYFGGSEIDPPVIARPALLVLHE